MQAAVKPLRLVTDPPGELEILFRAHHGRVFRTAQRITGSAADAEDVLQTVFLRLVKGHETYDLSQNPEAYLSRAAINASFARSPEVEQADRELQTLVREAVARLGKTAGEMFALRYYEGYDNQQIAGLLKTSPLVVGVVLHRARTKLRKEIGHYLERHHEKP